MEVKKSPKADLDNKKLTSYLIGYILILAVIFVSFEWTQTEVTRNTLNQVGEDNFEEEEIIEFSLQQPPPPPPPPQAAQDIITLVEEDVQIEEVEIQETESNEETEIDDRVFDPNAEYGTGEEVEEIIPFATMDNPPTFPGGDKALFEWLGKNLKYPKAAKNRGAKGRVMIEFIIDKEGKVSDAKVMKPVDEDLDAEALRLISSMPNWKPGMQRGKPVKVRYQMPVTFRLVK